MVSYLNLQNTLKPQKRWLNLILMESRGYFKNRISACNRFRWIYYTSNNKTTKKNFGWKKTSIFLQCSRSVLPSFFRFYKIAPNASKTHKNLDIFFFAQLCPEKLPTQQEHPKLCFWEVMSLQSRQNDDFGRDLKLQKLITLHRRDFGFQGVDVKRHIFHAVYVLEPCLCDQKSLAWSRVSNEIIKSVPKALASC